MDQIQTKAQDSVPRKWEGNVSATLEKVSPDQVWALYKDFFNFNKMFPALDICSAVSGVNGEPGCVRYCSSASIAVDFGDLPAAWANERLVTVDDDQRLLCYDILENNIGFESYVSTVRIVPAGDGCVIKWGFRVVPVEGWTLDDLVSKVYESSLRVIVERIKEGVLLQVN